MTYTPILASRPSRHRICPGGLFLVTLIVKRIVRYACNQLEISLPRQISLAVLIPFYYIQGSVIVCVTYTPILAPRPRRRHTCSGVRL